VVQAVWDLFAASDRWPVFDELDRYLDRTHQVVGVGDLVQSMPPNLLYGVYPHGGVPPGDDQPIGVTVAGAVRCRGSGEDLRRDGLLARLGHLLDVEQWGYVGVTPGENWAFTIGREVRRFRAVTDVTDYLGRRSPRTPATARPAPPFPTTPAGFQNAAHAADQR
jgi:hypothetical protein